MWMGLFLAIQEVTKERDILRREYMANLKLTPYVLSKVTVLGIIAMMQVIVMQRCVALFSHIASKPLPDTYILLSSGVENGCSLFFVSIASVCMGLMISALAKQPERVTPYILMPQIVLAGVLFDLGGIFTIISRGVFTYWGNRALCASADVNNLGEQILGFEPRKIYEPEMGNLLLSWSMLLIIGAAMLIITTRSLQRISREER